MTMRENRSDTTARWAALALPLALALACGGGGSATGEGDGIVRAVDRDAGRLTLDHGTIPGMMEAMSMEFTVADPALLAGLDPGDEIHFEVVEKDGTYTITEIETLELDGSE
jgi:Cu/Ag efflux protein CusF